MNEFWQTIFQLIFIPTSIVAVLAFVMREFFKSQLSKDVERYKTELQTDLESHKAKLKSEFDLKHFEFQTRFSLLHQKQAEIIQELFELLAEIFNLSQELANWEILRESAKFRGISKDFNEQEFLNKAITLLTTFGDLYDKKRLYLDKNIQNKISNAVRLFWMIFKPNSFSETMQVQLKNLLESEILPLMNDLESNFRKLLSVELSNLEVTRLQKKEFGIDER